MTLSPNGRNVAAEFMRRILPKTQQRRDKPPSKPYRRPEGFPAHVRDNIIAPRSQGFCELDGCGPATVFHHRRPRGSGGTSLEWVNRAANCLHLSDACHDWVEGRPRESSRDRSRILGWLISQNRDVVAEDVPVWYRGRWVYLTNNGGVEPITDAALLLVLTPAEDPDPSGMQPICWACWKLAYPAQPLLRLRAADAEPCCVCGKPALTGIHIDPTTAPYPARQKEL